MSRKMRKLLENFKWSGILFQLTVNLCVIQTSESYVRWQSSEPKSGQDRLNELLDLYDPSVGPNMNPEEGPVVVKVGYYLESVSEINPIEMSFEVDLYLRQSWVDLRLKHERPRHVTYRDPNATQKMWVPDIYFANAKSSSFQSVTKPNQLILVYPDGHIHYSVRVISKVACNLDLHNYPLDVQMCTIRLQSYAYTEKELRLEWFKKAVAFNPDIRMPEMSLQKVNATYCDGTYEYGQTESTSLTDTFSCLLGEIYVKRAIGYHMVQTYIPTCLIVVISWISFWIDPAAIPARISLSFTTLLTLATMTAGIRTALPPVSYAKAIDYWIGVCVMFVFGALLEFAFVSSFVRRVQKMDEPPKKEDNPLDEEDELRNSHDVTFLSRPQNMLVELEENGAEEGIPGRRRKRDSKGGAVPPLLNASCSSSRSQTRVESPRAQSLLRIKYKRIAKYTDMLSRFFFPAGFIVFNISYWLIFLDY